ncbi:MAG TPA: efflux RND transporter permease subunit [Polyangia bacterium]|nr:efflux RND transporter permease subunit [Polyangia bacterium]
MLNRLIDFAVHKRAFTRLATLAFGDFGIFTFTKLKIEAFPDVTNVQVMIITLCPGQAAEATTSPRAASSRTSAAP